jgi:hypothetical protein
MQGSNGDVLNEWLELHAAFGSAERRQIRNSSVWCARRIRLESMRWRCLAATKAF